MLASERIRQALLEAKSKRIPVVVSMGSVAASGGYWVSTPADFIYAEPSTITGSIGVFGVLPSFQGTLRKLGVGADGVKTTPLSGEPDLFKGPSPQASQLIQTGVEAMYGRFLSIVAASRHRTPQQIDQIAQGRVWDGGTALTPGDTPPRRAADPSRGGSPFRPRCPQLATCNLQLSTTARSFACTGKSAPGRKGRRRAAQGGGSRWRRGRGGAGERSGRTENHLLPNSVARAVHAHHALSEPASAAVRPEGRARDKRRLLDRPY